MMIMPVPLIAAVRTVELVNTTKSIVMTMMLALLIAVMPLLDVIGRPLYAHQLHVKKNLAILLMDANIPQ
jgi:hypothetical protein